MSEFLRMINAVGSVLTAVTLIIGLWAAWRHFAARLNPFNGVPRDIELIREQLNRIDTKVDSHGERIARLEGRFNGGSRNSVRSPR